MKNIINLKKKNKTKLQLSYTQSMRNNVLILKMSHASKQINIERGFIAPEKSKINEAKSF